MYLILFCLFPLTLLHSFDERFHFPKRIFCLKSQIKRELCREERGATQNSKTDFLLKDSQKFLGILKRGPKKRCEGDWFFISGGIVLHNFGYFWGLKYANCKACVQVCNNASMKMRCTGTKIDSPRSTFLSHLELSWCTLVHTAQSYPGA